MSDNELFEKDIWEYTSKRKAKQPANNGVKPAAQGTAAKATKPKQKATQKRRSLHGAKTQPPSGNIPQTSTVGGKREHTDGHSWSSQREEPPLPGRNPSPESPQPRHEGYCPSCQMPFSLLLVQSPRWHVSECLDAAGSTEKECPDGVTCSSAIPSHYKRYSHFQLAQSRAVNDSVFSLLNTPGSSCRQTAKLNLSQSPISWSKISENINKKRRSQNSPKTLSQTPPKDKSPASSQGSVKQTSLDAWLSSPSKHEKLSQETLSNSYPECADSTAKTPQSPQQAADLGDYGISYSPLIFNEELDSDEDPIKRLFSSESFEEEYGGTEDETQQGTYQSRCPQENGIIPSLKDSGTTQQPNQLSASSTSQCAANQQQSDHIPDYANWSECSSPASVIGQWETFQSQSDSFAECAPRFGNSTHLKERRGSLADCASSVEAGRRESCSVSSHTAQASEPEPTPSLSNKDKGLLTLNQTIPAMPSKSVQSQSCASTKGMKQMDIGVFFGLKPKPKEENPKTKVPPKLQNQNDVALPSERKPAQRKRKGQGPPLGDKDPLADHTNTEPEGAAGNQRRGWKRPRQFSTGEEGKGKKQCPFYKKIPGTGFTVDAFQYGQIEGCTAYFLTHFHSDHYGGLTKKFRCPIYCSMITGNLVQSKLRVESEFINTLPMNTECVVDGIRVVLLEANHCPGAVLLLFRLPNGTTILHTGDFRADRSMESYPALIGQRVHTLYLDTTYCSPEYTFPPQQEAIQFAVNTAFETVTLHSRTLVVCGTYAVGKEKVFLAIADVLGCKVCMSQDKYRTMQCLESADIRSVVTTDWHSTALHVLPMMQVNFKGLNVHLGKFSGKYDRVLAFKPTGWTYSDSSASVADIRPEIRGKVTMYGIPYSEHSSYSELKRFVQWLKPQKIIPTVNVGNYQSRSAMEKYFSEWLTGAAR
uniref:DNA cross-link repair 1A protein n=1 Tax=Xenopus tropicalis TaxID=8364 RepID=A0A1B8Y555_XENTR|eukprot:XP_017945311.1 PREDICTED: DNA cross-link repair 1A protein [Xenopus tropicalis]